MPPTSIDDSSSEAEILPFPTLPLLRGYIDDICASINNPILQKAQIDFLMMNIVAVLDALGSADDTIATLTREVESLKRSHGRLEVRCDQTHDNNRWLSQRYGETQKFNTELVEANKKLDSELSAASAKEEGLLERVACMESTVRRLSALIITKRIGPYKAIESWVINSIPPLDQATEGCESDNFAEPCLQDRGVVGVGGGHAMAAINSIGLGRNAVTHKLWNDAFTVTGSERHNSLSKSDYAVSEAPSELSVLTDVIKYKMVQNKVSRDMRTAARDNAPVRVDIQRNQLVINTTRAPAAENDFPIQSIVTARRLSLDIQFTELGNKIKPVESIEERVDLEEPFVRALPAKPQHKIYPAANHLAQRPLGETIQISNGQQIGNTCQDRTRYADIAREPGGGVLAYSDSINPQVVVADPNEVAGDWNDVPVPVELRRHNIPEKMSAPMTHERNVFMVGLPPTITVPMLATFIRGGKIESIIIVDEGKRGGVQSAVISFFSRKAAKRLIQWMLESPRLVIDRHIARPSLIMALPPPVVPNGGGSRVVIVKNIPLKIKNDEEFWNFVHEVAAKYTFKIGVQETRIWPVEVTDEEKGFAGVVAFDTYHMGVEMSKIFRQRLRLEVRWGHDRCEDPVVPEKFYEFVEYKKKKQYEGESD